MHCIHIKRYVPKPYWTCETGRTHFHTREIVFKPITGNYDGRIKT